jgi:hypothetical protein
MKKLFGQYLVEKGLLKEDELVLALVDQIKKLPSIIEIIFEKKMLSSKEILSILLLQQNEKLSFVEAAKKLQLWTKELELKVDLELSYKKIPLGELLVSSKVLSLESIVEALDEFLTESSQEAVSKSSPITNISNEPLVVTPSISTDYSTYFDKLSLETYLEFKILLGLSSSSSDDVVGLVKKGIDAIQILKGAARFVNLSQSEKLIQKILDLQNQALKLIQDGKTKNELIKFEDDGLKMMDALWLIREELENGKIEDDIIKNNSIII